ncbi:unnamed protein product [Brassica rapa subsp. trilocularis]
MSRAIHLLGENLSSSSGLLQQPLAPGLKPGPYDEQTNRGAGIYAVPVHHHQFGAPLSSNYLIPLTYNIPTYQTGALAPFVRWLSQGMQRAAVPPPPRPNRPADNDPAAAVPLNEDAALGNILLLQSIFPSVVITATTYAEATCLSEGQENEGDNGNRANANENADAGQQGNQWWGIVKEIQMIVFGFITSLLPGFHNID